MNLLNNKGQEQCKRERLLIVKKEIITAKCSTKTKRLNEEENNVNAPRKHVRCYVVLSMLMAETKSFTV